jgi:spermidine synthase
LPLALYLITFILCFDGEGWYRPAIMRPLAVIACGVMLAGLTLRFGDAGLQRGLIPIRYAVPLYALGLFLTCMFVHGELVARKPSPAHLTRFYLMVSLGGAIGGLLVGIAAPLLFSWYWELPIALTIVAALGVTLSATATSLQTGRTPHLAVKLIGLLAVVGCATLLGDYVGWIRGEMREVSRNFYGTLRVRAVEGQEPLQARRQLLHGEILHGEQFTDPSRRSEPTTYYGPQSGIGQLIAAQQAARGNTPLRVGLIGVGIGTLAGYGRTGDVYRLYELNPAVFELARSQFTYLSDSAAQIQEVLGDARLMLEGEAAQRFDVLAVDAFSSDSIPVHLLTREALAVYRRHLAEQGAVAFHVTNRYLDLKGVVRRLADETGMQAVLISDEPAASHHTYRSDWIVLTAQPSLANTLRAQGGLTPQAPPAGRATWTDDHHNLFEVLK